MWPFGSPQGPGAGRLQRRRVLGGILVNLPCVVAQRKEQGVEPGKADWHLPKIEFLECREVARWGADALN